MKTKTKQLSDEMSLVNEIKQINEEINKVLDLRDSLVKRRKDIQGEIFFLKTGRKFGEMFTWNKKEYEIVSEKSIYLNFRCYDANHLVDFLNGKAKSPVKG